MKFFTVSEYYWVCVGWAKSFNYSPTVLTPILAAGLICKQKQIDEFFDPSKVLFFVCVVVVVVRQEEKFSLGADPPGRLRPRWLCMPPSLPPVYLPAPCPTAPPTTLILNSPYSHTLPPSCVLNRPLLPSAPPGTKVQASSHSTASQLCFCADFFRQ